MAVTSEGFEQLKVFIQTNWIFHGFWGRVGEDADESTEIIRKETIPTDIGNNTLKYSTVINGIELTTLPVRFQNSRIYDSQGAEDPVIVDNFEAFTLCHEEDELTLHHEVTVGE